MTNQEKYFQHIQQRNILRYKQYLEINEEKNNSKRKMNHAYEQEGHMKIAINEL